MSLQTEVQTALGNRKLLGMTMSFYTDWPSFWAACPLSRALLVNHDALGREVSVPENGGSPVHQGFFQVDVFSMVWTKQGVPVYGAIYRRLSPDTLEHVLRLGQASGNCGLRRVFWRLGIRKLVYKISERAGSTQAYMDAFEAGHGNIVVHTHPGDGYRHTVVQFNQEPPGGDATD